MRSAPGRVGAIEGAVSRATGTQPRQVEGVFATAAGARRAAEQIRSALPDCEISLQELPLRETDSGDPARLRLRVAVTTRSTAGGSLYVIRDSDPAELDGEPPAR